MRWAVVLVDGSSPELLQHIDPHRSPKVSRRQSKEASREASAKAVHLNELSSCGDQSCTNDPYEASEEVTTGDEKHHRHKTHVRTALKVETTQKLAEKARENAVNMSQKRAQAARAAQLDAARGKEGATAEGPIGIEAAAAVPPVSEHGVDAVTAPLLAE